MYNILLLIYCLQSGSDRHTNQPVSFGKNHFSVFVPIFICLQLLTIKFNFNASITALTK